MPGRGQPWKKGGLVDDTVQSRDIEDGTIEEVDLDTALTEKVNTGGGGGAQLGFACISDDFVARSIERINESYVIEQGTINFPTDELYGVIELDSGSISTEGAGQLTTENTFEVNPDLGDIRCQFVHIAENTAQMHVLGFVNRDLGSTTDESFLLATLTNAMLFYCDPAIDNNWRALSLGGGTPTIVDTGVARTFGERQRFEAKFDKVGNKAEFFIEGNLVATITTNFPEGRMFMTAYAVNKVAVQRKLKLDFWQADANRLNE